MHGDVERVTDPLVKIRVGGYPAGAIRGLLAELDPFVATPWPRARTKDGNSRPAAVSCSRTPASVRLRESLTAGTYIGWRADRA
jgi:hypothetical protein